MSLESSSETVGRKEMTSRSRVSAREKERGAGGPKGEERGWTGLRGKKSAQGGNGFGPRRKGRKRAGPSGFRPGMILKIFQGLTFSEKLINQINYK